MGHTIEELATQTSVSIVTVQVVVAELGRVTSMSASGAGEV